MAYHHRQPDGHGGTFEGNWMFEIGSRPVATTCPFNSPPRPTTERLATEPPPATKLVRQSIKLPQTTAEMKQFRQELRLKREEEAKKKRDEFVKKAIEWVEKELIQTLTLPTVPRTIVYSMRRQDWEEFAETDPLALQELKRHFTRLQYIKSCRVEATTQFGVFGVQIDIEFTDDVC